MLVIKKNYHTLGNLIAWLEKNNARAGTAKVDAPMLLIDDEADNASINTKWGKGGVARINGQIRSLLNLFERSCYVGYTATPFANIFVDPDTDDEMFLADLFPENFIVGLDPPSNYLGPTKMFYDEPTRFVREISDNENIFPLKHPIDFNPKGLPESLREAIRSFVLVRAIRLARGHASSHNSMLINASRFTDVQDRLRNEVHQYLRSLQAAIRMNGALDFEVAASDPAIASLHTTWQTEFSDSPESWEVVYQRLHAAASPIKAITVNSKSPETLDYAEHDKAGLNVIAVGGYSLSRGLTLEGLSISYFLRNSMMYDTLMQMGRWFGFRTGYEDLCRVWMPEEAEGWYAHIAEAVEELRTDLRNMERSGATPREFGLKVRSHPDTLLVTARNKVGAGKLIPVRIGLSNKFVETAVLRRDVKIIKSNRTALDTLVARLENLGYPIAGAEELPSGFLLRSVPVGPVIAFVSEFTNDPASLLTDPTPISNYILERDESELAKWDVFFPSIQEPDSKPPKSEKKARSRTEIGGRIIVQQRRTSGDKSDAKSIRVTNKQRVSSRGVERFGLTDYQVDAAQKAFKSTPEGMAQAKGGGPVNYPDRIYRALRDRPLLVIHLLDIEEPERDPIGQNNPQLESVSGVVAWSISFPTTELPEDRVEYMVNGPWLENLLRVEQDSDEDLEVEDV